MGRPGDRVIVAMSGGVDSSVAAARLLDQGLQVIGVTLHLWDYPDTGEKGRCCAPEDQYDARRVADQLGFPHYTFDRRELFRELVVDPFVSAYVSGTTPSPCVSCNRGVKMAELFGLADKLGARWVATGHYARTVASETGVDLHRGVDPRKDQSYFLHTLGTVQLERLLLPLGGSTKEQVRADAVRLDLPGATKGESQELCFVATGRYDAFIEERAQKRVRPGPILDTSGKQIGEHEGVHRFTIGQRKGIGVALGHPAFVVGVDAEAGAVVVGREDDLLCHGAVLAGDARFFEELPRTATVQVRARHQGAAARLAVEVDATGAEAVVVRFEQPVRAVCPGQVAVAYDGTRVLGGGTIVRTLRPARETARQVTA